MQNQSISQVTVLDLVPFGQAEKSTQFYALRLTPPKWEKWVPGQFVMIRQGNNPESPTWGRPFSICHLTKRHLILFFQTVGRVTRELAALQPGDTLDIWGPLGNSFAMEKDTPTLLLAGGIGIAPFVGYAHEHPAPWNITMEFGHRMPIECYPFESIADKVYATSHLEEKSGDLEKFIEVIERRIIDHAEKGVILACGPTPFLKTVQELANKHKAKAQLSLEHTMACGIGACLGCVVKAGWKPFPTPHASEEASTAKVIEPRYLQTCTCGPVFWAHNVVL